MDRTATEIVTPEAKELPGGVLGCRPFDGTDRAAEDLHTHALGGI